MYIIIYQVDGTLEKKVQIAPIRACFTAWSAYHQSAIRWIQILNLGSFVGAILQVNEISDKNANSKPFRLGTI